MTAPAVVTRLPLGTSVVGVPALPTGGTLLCYADPARFAAPDLCARLDAALSEDERARMARFRFERDRHNYRVAHAMVRALLAREVGGTTEALTFALGPYGRPELVQGEGEKRLRFNLSHTHGLVACGLTFEREIGVDVEHVDRRVGIDELAGQVLAPAEHADLCSHNVQLQRLRFFEYWTLKEAYIKAVGQGLGLPLRSISFVVKVPPPIAQAEVEFLPGYEDDPARLAFRCWPVGPAHQLALAVEREAIPDIALCEIGPQALDDLLASTRSCP